MLECERQLLPLVISEDAIHKQPGRSAQGKGGGLAQELKKGLAMMGKLAFHQVFLSHRRPYF